MTDEMDEIWTLFADDGAQAMDAMETALLALQEGNPETQSSHVAALFRAVHTFKGNSRVLGLSVVESRAHLAEDLIGLVRDNGVPLDQEILDILLETGDRLREMLDETARTRSDADPATTDALMARLRDKIGRCSNPEISAQPAVLPPVAENLPEPEPTIEAQPEPVPEPVSPPEAPAAGASAPQAKRLVDDPGYRQIFLDMVADTLRRLQKCNEDAAPEGSKRPVADLAHAARQLGLDDWTEAMAYYPASPSKADLGAIIRVISQMRDGLVPAQALTEAQDGLEAFLASMIEPMNTLSELGRQLRAGTLHETSDIIAIAQRIGASSEARGLVRLDAAARAMTAVDSTVSFELTELRLYEEIAAVEATLSASALAPANSPSAFLTNWSADQVLVTLNELSGTLERLRNDRNIDEAFRRFERQIRLIHHACRHYGLESASQLAMSVLDLFSRNHVANTEPDALLLRFTRGLVETLERVFDALRNGGEVSTDHLAKLCAELEQQGFHSAGVMTAASIERVLGLPNSFHRVLSPTSVAVATEALKQGLNFFILRTDINDDQQMSEDLFELIGSGNLKSVTNVTVFDGTRTLFDFLVATEFDEVALVSALATIDPSGTKLTVSKLLNPDKGQLETAQPGEDTAVSEITAPDFQGFSNDFLERIGEISAGQALVHGMLNDLAENSLSDALEATLRRHDPGNKELRDALRGLIDAMMERLRGVAQLETQLLGQMTELQQLAADQRAKALDTVLRPLSAMVSTEARREGREASLTSGGGDMRLDISVLDQIRRSVRSALLVRLSGSKLKNHRFHLSASRNDDHVSLVLDDDDKADLAPAQLATLEQDIKKSGGTIRSMRLPDGRHRLHFDFALNLIVLEGMVVGIGGTRYVFPVESIRTILQPDQSRIGQISASNREKWLRLEDNEIVAIRPLGVAKTDTAEIEPGKAGPHHNIHVILRRASDCVAIPVDELVGQQLVLLRPLRGMMSKLRNVTGVALLAGGEVGMVLSPAALCAPGPMSSAQDRLH